MLVNILSLLQKFKDNKTIRCFNHFNGKMSGEFANLV